MSRKPSAIAVTNFVGKSGGADIGQLLSGALK
jgi:hypothetical protein